MFATIDDFCHKFGPESYGEFIRLCRIQSMTDEQRGKEFGKFVRRCKRISSEDSNQFDVSGSCVSRWRGKFADVFILSKEVILDYLQQEYNIQRSYVDTQKEFIDAERAQLHYVKGRLSGRTTKADQDANSR